VISFLGFLKSVRKEAGPHLVVAPLRYSVYFALKALSLLHLVVAPLRISVYLLYWYKSTNTETPLSLSLYLVVAPLSVMNGWLLESAKVCV
jgi:hypothetical protein